MRTRERCRLIAAGRRRPADGRRRPADGRRCGGFTLAEMMVAIAITLIFGAMAVGALRYGSELWRTGNRRSYAYDVAAAIFQQLQTDVGDARSQFWGSDAEAFDNRIGFYADWDILDMPNPIPDARRQWLAFVRGIPDAAVNPRIRTAGDGQDNDGDNGTNPDSPDEEAYNLRDDDGDGLTDEDLMPLEGVCEVAYRMGIGSWDRYTLYRAVRSPIGGNTSLLRPQTFDGDGQDWLGNPFPEVDGDPATNDDDPWVLGQPLSENVILHFELRLWSQYTTTWADTAPAAAPWANSFQPEYMGPAFAWDSRGADTAPEAYLDNGFPRAVMAVLVIEPPARLSRPGELTLAQGISGSDLSIPVNGDMPPHNDRWPYILISDPDSGDEWVRYQRFDADSGSFILDPADPVGNRGVRGTAAVSHAAIDSGGAPVRVRFGVTLSTVFHNPRSREYWGD